MIPEKDLRKSFVSIGNASSVAEECDTELMTFANSPSIKTNRKAFHLYNQQQMSLQVTPTSARKIELNTKSLGLHKPTGSISNLVNETVKGAFTGVKKFMKGLVKEEDENLDWFGRIIDY